jgi:hypothetical protein
MTASRDETGCTAHLPGARRKYQPTKGTGKKPFGTLRALSRFGGIVVASLAVLAALFLPAAAAASGTVFYGGWYDDAIGSVGFDGSDPRPSLIGDDAIPEAMVVSGDYLYWEANSSPIRFGRSRLDGTEVDPDFFFGGKGQVQPEGLSIVDGRIYWAETGNITGLGPGYLSSADLDGSDRALRTVSLGRNTESAVLVNGGWAFFVISKDVRGIQRYSIARVRLDGRGSRRLVAANRPFVGESLTTLGSHVFWLEQDDSGRLFIARASLDAGSIDTRFRRIPEKGCHVGDEVVGTAISTGYYFLGCGSGNIDRVSLTGRPHVRTLVTGADLTSGPVLAATP